MIRWVRRSSRRPSIAQRITELETLRRSAAAAADLFRRHDEGRFADLYDALVAGAERLIAEGFDQGDLNDLSAVAPGGSSWLDPRAADFDMPRETWQDEVAQVVVACTRAALNLRAIGDAY